MDSGQHAGVRRPGIIRRFVNLVVCIAIVLAAAWGIRSFVIEPFEVPSASMETTIMTGDRLFAEKVSYHFSEPKAGEIVVFSDPQVPSRVLVKRIIATEGQTVNLVNGKALRALYTGFVVSSFQNCQQCFPFFSLHYSCRRSLGNGGQS